MAESLQTRNPISVIVVKINLKSAAYKPDHSPRLSSGALAGHAANIGENLCPVHTPSPYPTMRLEAIGVQKLTKTGLIPYRRCMCAVWGAATGGASDGS